MRVLVLGAGGQLGADLIRTDPGHTLIAHKRADADITDGAALARYVRDARPKWILNTVADNRTEAAESDPGPPFAVNALAPRALAEVAAAAGARVLHFSTDFVFDGRKGAPYVESDSPSPLNLYGVSKYAGERFILAASDRNIVVRTASLFGRAGCRAKGGNFVDTIRRRARAAEPIRAVADIFMSPTSTRDLAEKVWELLERDVPGGLCHLVNDGGASWCEFARAIVEIEGLDVSVEAIPAAAWPGKMRRAPDTRLASEQLSRWGLRPLRPWREALTDYLTEEIPTPGP